MRLNITPLFLNYLLRFLAAYSMVVEKTSGAVALTKFSPGGSLQFGVIAKRPIMKGTYIYELMGIMASDTTAPHSRLSEIFPHPHQRKGLEPKILFGPARFANHDCKKSNIEVRFLPSYLFLKIFILISI